MNSGPVTAGDFHPKQDEHFEVTVSLSVSVNWRATRP
jgi:hypothetical protein